MVHERSRISSRSGEVAKAVWEAQWDALLALVGIITTAFTTSLPFPLLVLLLAIAIALTGNVIRETRRTIGLLREKHVPVVVLVGKGEDVAEAMWQDIQRAMARWDFDAERYRRDFDVEREDLFLHHEEPLPTDPSPWLRFVKEFRRKIERVGGRLAGSRVFHVFINGPVSLAAGLGASIGTMHEVVVHQWFPGTAQAPYHPVVDFYALSVINPKGMHFLEDPVTGEFRYVTGEGEPGDAEELYVSVWTARDDPRADVNRMAEEAKAAGRSPGVFHVVQREPQSLDTADDWILCAREILTLLFQQISRIRPKRVHLFLSAPVALAFSVGMGIEHFMPVTVYNWWGKEQQYHPVLPLEQLARTS